MNITAGLSDFPIISHLHLVGQIHPFIYELVEKFQEHGEVAEIDINEITRDYRLKEQVEWTLLMIDYFRTIPEGFLSKISFQHQFFSDEEVRRFIRVKTAKQREVVVLHVMFKNTFPGRFNNYAWSGKLQQYLERVVLEIQDCLNLEDNKQEIDRLEVKAGRACNAWEWDSFNSKEVKFLQDIISMFVSLEAITNGVLEWRLDASFFEIHEKEGQVSNYSINPFLQRLVKEKPVIVDKEQCLQNILSNNSMFSYDEDDVEIMVLNSGHEWKGFVFAFDRPFLDTFQENLKNRMRSEYNKYFILTKPEDSTFRDLQVFGMMRVDPAPYPDCRDETLDSGGLGLYLSEYVDFCNDCGKVEDGESWCCENGCAEFPTFFN